MIKYNNKKGVALELAVMVMFLVMSICTIIAAVVLRETARDAISNRYYYADGSIEEVGENFYSDIKKNSSNELYGEELLNSINIKNVSIYSERLTSSVSYHYDGINHEYTLTLTGLSTNTTDESEKEYVVYLIVEVNVDNNNSAKINRWYYHNPLDKDDYISKLEKEIE